MLNQNLECAQEFNSVQECCSVYMVPVSYGTILSLFRINNTVFILH